MLRVRPFVLVNAERCYLDLRDTRNVRWLNSAACPTCDSDASETCLYDALRDQMVCAACAERFDVNEG